MKITIYTVNDCQFSKQEKEYLQIHNLQFEEKNLETNKDWLTEMLAVSNNFAGTPVTKIEKDDGQIVVLKGFTKEEFDQTLQQSPAVSTPVTASTPEPEPIATVIEPPTANSVSPQATDKPTSPATPTTPPPTPQPTPPETPPTPTTPLPEVPTTPAPAEQAPVTPTPSTPTEQAKPEQDQQLNSILQNLQNIANKPGSTPQNLPASPSNPTNLPTIPEPGF
ncbi:hypothetical protein HY407_00785 [Candidatus Gottesmanbacteria bacterium]|nr:hypothetical protein [Candidatus Gottesmanbacteria bacterium]